MTERIREITSAVLKEYGIQQKVSFVIADNAVNMKKAFGVTFPDHAPATFDDEDIWEDVETSTDLGYERLSCFAHSLQLVVADGLRHSNPISIALSKVSRLAALLHSSTSFKVSKCMAL